MTREEAINKVRWGLMGLVIDKDVRDAFETLIPELRESESEDEKIRKELIFLLKEEIPQCSIKEHAEKLKEFVAYLEKQKKPENTSASVMAPSCWEVEQQEQKPVVTHGETYRVDTLGTQQVIAGKMPQKPAEWSEDYDEENIQTRFAFYTYKDDPSTLYLSNVFVEETSRNHGFGTRILRAAEKVAETIGAITISLKVKQDSLANAWYRKNGYGYVAFEDGYDWLEKNLEYLKPAKSAEWSEDTISKAIKEVGLTQHQIDWFKTNVFPPKQEWSEEDESCWNLIWDILDGPFTASKESFKKAAAWFLKNCPKGTKSLRPSWKPSEQEKGALRTAIHVLTEERSFPKAASHLQAILDAFDGEEPRKDWRPSEAQMRALKVAFRKDGDDEYRNIINSLYNDLIEL